MKQIIEPIGYIETDYKDKFGVPRQSGRVPSAVGRIVFYKPYSSEDAFRGIEEFSHLWVIFDFSLAHTTEFQPTVRPPRLGGNTRVGVFASRSPFRPNSLGLSSVKLEKVEHTDSGIELMVSGVDIVSGTPIYDIKPYLPITDCHTDAIGGYSDKHANHKLQVSIEEKLLGIIPAEKQQTLIDSLAEDVRPAFQDDNKRVYSMLFDDFDVHFVVDGTALTVTGIDKTK